MNLITLTADDQRKQFKNLSLYLTLMFYTHMLEDTCMILVEPIDTTWP